MDPVLRQTLLSEYSLGPLKLRNRLVLSTRIPALAVDSSAEEQAWSIAAAAGLLIVEADKSRSASWRPLCDAIHDAGGTMFLRLNGGVSSRGTISSLEPREAAPILGPEGPPSKHERLAFHELDIRQICAFVAQYACATRQALEAGFDGVELGASSDSLAMRFLSSRSNRREDRYGGSLCRRARFVLEVLEAMVREAGEERVGIEVAAVLASDEVYDCDPVATNTYLGRVASGFGLAYLHVVQRANGSSGNGATTKTLELMRRNFRGTIVAGYASLDASLRALATRDADLVGLHDAAILRDLVREDGCR